MTTVRRRMSIFVTGAAVLGALTACGGGGDSATSTSSSASKTSSSSSSSTSKPGAGTVYKQARTTALAAKSGHVKGSVKEDGATLTLDLSGTADGKNQKLLIQQGSEGLVTIVTVGSKNWLMADKAFWTANGGAAVAAKVGGKYVELPAEQAKEFGDLNLKGLLTDMFSDKELSTLESLTTSVKEESVDGKAAYVLADKGSSDGQVYVTADGTAHLIKIVGPASSPGTLTFSEWDAVKAVAAPPASQIVTL